MHSADKLASDDNDDDRKYTQRFLSGAERDSVGTDVLSATVTLWVQTSINVRNVDEDFLRTLLWGRPINRPH